MMFGFSHGANPIFCNKKIKDWTSKTLANSPHPTSDNISFLSYTTPHPPQSGRHMCITPKQHHEAELFLSETNSLCSSTLSSNNDKEIFQKT